MSTLPVRSRSVNATNKRNPSPRKPKPKAHTPRATPSTTKSAARKPAPPSTAKPAHDIDADLSALPPDLRREAVDRLTAIAGEQVDRWRETWLRAHVIAVAHAQDSEPAADDLEMRAGAGFPPWLKTAAAFESFADGVEARLAALRAAVRAPLAPGAAGVLQRASGELEAICEAVEQLRDTRGEDGISSEMISELEDFGRAIEGRGELTPGDLGDVARMRQEHQARARKTPPPPPAARGAAISAHYVARADALQRLAGERDGGTIGVADRLAAYQATLRSLAVRAGIVEQRLRSNPLAPDLIEAVNALDRDNYATGAQIANYGDPVADARDLVQYIIDGAAIESWGGETPPDCPHVYPSAYPGGAGSTCGYPVPKGAKECSRHALEAA